MSRARILVVEDDPDIAELLRMALAEEGYEVEVARNGVEGYDRARVHPPDLALLDVVMPGLTGLALYDLLQADGLTRDIPVVFQSALSAPPNIVEGLQAGETVRDYVSKPFDVAELLARVDVALTHHPRAHEEDL